MPQVELSLFILYCVVAATYLPGYKDTHELHRNKRRLWTGSPKMYGHMQKARKKALSEAVGGSVDEKTKKR
jgi:hypothetical protein